MICIQTMIEIDEEVMERMVATTISDLEITLEDYGLPATKEIKIALLKETMKELLQEDLTT